MTTVAPEHPTQLRPNRSFVLVALALAVVVAAGTWRIVSSDDAVKVSNTARVYSPSGHRPHRPSQDPVVTVAWTPVSGAAGYWWALVNDTSRLPEPAIRASADDGMVSFRFTGRRYFVLRTAMDRGGRYHWSDSLVYGPIIVRPGADTPGETLDDLEGTVDEPGTGPGTSYGGRTGSGGAEGSAAYDAEPAEPPVPPGNPGEPGTGSGQPGGYGEPGEPGSGGGGGQPRCTGGSCPGQEGADGPAGRPGSVPP